MAWRSLTAGLRTLYLNGQRDPAALVSSPTVYLADMTMPLRVNQDDSDDDSMTGVYDEVRVSTTARSPGWILSTYNNMNDPGDIGSPGFYICGFRGGRSAHGNIVDLLYRQRRRRSGAGQLANGPGSVQRGL